MSIFESEIPLTNAERLLQWMDKYMPLAQQAKEHCIDYTLEADSIAEEEIVQDTFTT